MLYILEGKVRHEYGPGLKQVLENEAAGSTASSPGFPTRCLISAKPTRSSPSSLDPTPASGKISSRIGAGALE